MDRLTSMRLFVAVVKTGGFGSAAKKMNVSPPVVTRAVAELESALGVRLLHRTTRQVSVTEAGSRYMVDCQRILTDVAEIESLASGVGNAVSGRLVVTAPEAFSQIHLMPVVLNYLKTYPNTEVVCRFNDRISSAEENDVDIAISIGKLSESCHHTTLIGTTKYAIYASPDYLKAFGRPDLPETLRHHTTISAEANTSSNEWSFTNNKSITRIRLMHRLTVESIEDALHATLDGFGIARLPSYATAHYIREGRLIEILDEYGTDSQPIHIISNGKFVTRRARAFLDMVTKDLSTTRAPSPADHRSVQ